MGEKEKVKIPKWLKKVQQNSWEPEILLSGFVLIGLLQLPMYIDKFSMVANPELLKGNLSGLFSGLKLAIYALVSGLIVHLFFRGVWVGYVGLSYTFPNGVDLKRLDYQPQFMKRIERIPPLSSQVDTLEKICSSMFSTCFFMMMCIVGIMVAVLIFVGFVYLLDFVSFGQFFKLFELITGNNFDIVISAVMILMSIDFITIGLFRRHRIIAKIFYPIHTLIGWITLSRYYRPIYYTFASNLNKVYVGIFLLVFCGGTLFGQRFLNTTLDGSIISSIKFYNQGATQSFFSGYYSDRNENWESYRAVIPSPIVSSRFLELTIKHDGFFEKHMIENCNLIEDDLDGSSDKIAEEKMKCVNEFYNIYIDGSKVENPGWMSYFYQKQKRKSFITFLDTDSLAPGKHLLEVKTNFTKSSYFAHIYFFKE